MQLAYLRRLACFEFPRGGVDMKFFEELQYKLHVITLETAGKSP